MPQLQGARRPPTDPSRRRPFLPRRCTVGVDQNAQAKKVRVTTLASMTRRRLPRVINPPICPSPTPLRRRWSGRDAAPSPTGWACMAAQGHATAPPSPGSRAHSAAVASVEAPSRPPLPPRRHSRGKRWAGGPPTAATRAGVAAARGADDPPAPLARQGSSHCFDAMCPAADGRGRPAWPPRDPRCPPPKPAAAAPPPSPPPRWPRPSAPRPSPHLFRQTPAFPPRPPRGRPRTRRGVTRWPATAPHCGGDGAARGREGRCC